MGGVALNQLRLEALRVNGGTRVSRLERHMISWLPRLEWRSTSSDWRRSVSTAARGCREWRHMGVETGAAHDFVVAEIGVALNQLRLEALRVNGGTRVSRMAAHGCRDWSNT